MLKYNEIILRPFRANKAVTGTKTTTVVATKVMGTTIATINNQATVTKAVIIIEIKSN